MFKTIFATLVMLGVFGAIVGCNTIAGGGKRYRARR
jgi:predicted small secreted protein